MFPQKIKKAVKPLALLLIISSIISPVFSFSQGDTAKLKKEITAILKKYGYKDAIFNLKVESSNQKGGQTAFEINNYTGREIHVVNGPNYGVNGNVSNEKQLTDEDKVGLISFITKLKQDSSTNTMSYSISTHSASNGAKFAFQITEYLNSLGYKYNGGGVVYGQPFKGVTVDLRRYNGKDKDFVISIVVGIL